MTAGGWKSTAQGASLKFSRNSLYLHLLNTIVMPQFRNMTPAEIAAVESLGSSAEAWSQVSVADDFTPFQLLQSHLEGKVATNDFTLRAPAEVAADVTYRTLVIESGATIEGHFARAKD